MYREISRNTEVILKTLVEFTFNINGVEIIKEIEVVHFNPQSEEDIELGINNRYLSEERELLEGNE